MSCGKCDGESVIVGQRLERIEGALFGVGGILDLFAKLDKRFNEWEKKDWTGPRGERGFIGHAGPQGERGDTVHYLPSVSIGEDGIETHTIQQRPGEAKRFA